MSRKRFPGICVHCRQPRARAGDGLCHACAAVPALRARHHKPTDVEGVGTANRARALPTPTSVPPVEERREQDGVVVHCNPKLDVLIERAAREEQLWHPDDARPDLS